MTSTFNVPSSRTFTNVRECLLSSPAPLLPPSKPIDDTLTDAISSLNVHPALEAALHLFNADLYSAHFLCRHMQAAPAWEGMFLHGILHRLEGDYDNARAWYRDVASSEVFAAAWPATSQRGKEAGKDETQWDQDEDDGSLERALRFIGDIQRFKEGKNKGGSTDTGEQLEAESGREMEAVLEFCIAKFGTERVPDASEYWSQPEGEHKKLGQEMVSGGKGFRKF